MCWLWPRPHACWRILGRCGRQESSRHTLGQPCSRALLGLAATWPASPACLPARMPLPVPPPGLHPAGAGCAQFRDCCHPGRDRWVGGAGGCLVGAQSAAAPPLAGRAQTSARQRANTHKHQGWADGMLPDVLCHCRLHPLECPGLQHALSAAPGLLRRGFRWKGRKQPAALMPPPPTPTPTPRCTQARGPTWCLPPAPTSCAVAHPCRLPVLPGGGAVPWRHRRWSAGAPTPPRQPVAPDRSCGTRHGTAWNSHIPMQAPPRSPARSWEASLATGPPGATPTTAAWRWRSCLWGWACHCLLPCSRQAYLAGWCTGAALAMVHACAAA